MICFTFGIKLNVSTNGELYQTNAILYILVKYFVLYVVFLYI